MTIGNPDIVLDIRDLTCGYGDKSIIEDFNLQVKPGEIIAITGPNGCGKSTLLKAIYQLCKIEKGEIQFKEISLLNKTPEQVKELGIAYFMQKNSIFTQLSVKENILLSLNGMNSLEKQNKLEEIIRLYPQMDEWMKKTAGLLSGGQRQQLAMGMLLSQNAKLWLLDEPTAGLDEKNSANFITTLRQTFNNRNLLILLVEHKKQIIDDLATRILKL